MFRIIRTLLDLPRRLDRLEALIRVAASHPLGEPNSVPDKKARNLSLDEYVHGA